MVAQASSRVGQGRDEKAASAQRIAELEADNAALRTEAERFRRLLDSATEYAIVTLNKDGRITGWSNGAHAIVGYGDAEILGRSGEVFFPAEDRAKGVFTGELRRAVTEGRAPNERWHLRRDGSRFWASGAMMPLLDEDGQADGFLNVFRDASNARAEEERRVLLLAEMGHRMRNVLSTVQAVATQTLHQANVPSDVQTTFTDRLHALARSHELLLRSDWNGAPLSLVVERALSPYGAADRAQISGPPVLLPANAVEILGLSFHELATNAAKYGALSVPEGRVEVRWGLRRMKEKRRFADITWREHGGPLVAPPARRGFGSRLLEGGFASDCGGSVRLDFRPEGLVYRISVPIRPEGDGK